ncbi:MAG TPA: hypothetical protein VHC19_04675 [Pirellulales bacterium]|nr:hypothetical protein [Pirellulales bacterium]
MPLDAFGVILQEIERRISKVFFAFPLFLVFVPCICGLGCVPAAIPEKSWRSRVTFSSARRPMGKSGTNYDQMSVSKAAERHV